MSRTVEVQLQIVIPKESATGIAAQPLACYRSTEQKSVRMVIS
jgi:hypothetical protein